MRSLKKYGLSFRQFIGWPHAAYRANEQWVATLGGFTSILLVFLSSRAFLGDAAAVFLLPSLGASAVLIFAVPHSPLAQPWAVLGGHLLSALIGVTCYRLIPNAAIAAACAVGFSIGAMHLCRCLHPPGGATALSAVIGGSAIHALGYRYPLFPVALNCLIILSIGFLFNAAFPWRRYPASLMRYAAPRRNAHIWPEISEAQIEAAMAELNVVVDISPRELAIIIEQTLQKAAASSPAPKKQIRIGGVYCNEQPGPQWSVRQVEDERLSDIPEFDLVIYRILEGPGRDRLDSCTRTEFAKWVASEVAPT